MSVPAAVLIPVKAFGDAKSRLAPALPEPERVALARRMATHVVRAAAPLPVTVVCDDQEVAAWARQMGATVAWAREPGLNEAVRTGITALAHDGVEVAVVAHADLPFAQRLDRVLRFDGVTLVPDRHDDGTNVVVVPVALPFRFSYGPGSFERHSSEARRAGGLLRIARLPDLQWDVDTARDLSDPAPAGLAPRAPSVVVAACR